MRSATLFDGPRHSEDLNGESTEAVGSPGVRTGGKAVGAEGLGRAGPTSFGAIRRMVVIDCLLASHSMRRGTWLSAIVPGDGVWAGPQV